MRVANVETADAAGEVDERVAVDVGDRRTAAFLNHDRKEDCERVGDRPVVPFEDFLRARARHLRLEIDRARKGHVPDDIGREGPL
jgi:hypothetical protein